MAPIAPGALAESASAKMRFLYSAEYWRRLALTTTSGSGIVLASPGATLRSASLRSASLSSAPGEAKTTEGGGTPFTDFFMSISFSALYTKYRKGRRLTDLGTEGSANTVYRTINAQGSGTASVDGVTQTTNQSITFALNLLGYYPGTCSWSAWPGTGTAANRASINDVVVGAGGVCTTTAQADGSGSPLVALAISGTNTYSFNATDNLDGKVIYTGDPLSCNPRTQDETIGWGPGGLPGPTPQFFPWPSSASMSGNFTFSAIPGDNISFLPANWIVTWNFSPAPDDTCKDCNEIGRASCR